MKNVINGEKLHEWVDSAFSCSYMKGFHAECFSDSHYLMLLLTEVSEAVEADRRGRRADVDGFLRSLRELGDEFFSDAFEHYIKDSVEDELADVCIRLFDFCGLLGVSLSWFNDDDDRAEAGEFWDALFGGERSFTEQSFMLCSLITEAGCTIEQLDLEIDEECKKIREELNAVFSFVYWWMDSMGMDIVFHIEQKMRYNEGRPARHGKRY